jgi:hypothetical protein
MRLISVDSLMRLMALKEEVEEPRTIRCIYDILLPRGGRWMMVLFGGGVGYRIGGLLDAYHGQPWRHALLFVLTLGAIALLGGAAYLLRRFVAKDTP